MIRHEAYYNTHPEVAVVDEDEGVFDVNGHPVLLDMTAVEAENGRLAQEEEANEYQTQRSFEYPSIGDQLDALFHAGVFPAEMAAEIQAIKDKYPK